MEQWKVVPDTDNVYWASDLGRIKRVGKVGHTGRIMPEKNFASDAQWNGPFAGWYQRSAVVGSQTCLSRLAWAYSRGEGRSSPRRCSSPQLPLQSGARVAGG